MQRSRLLCTLSLIALLGAACQSSSKAGDSEEWSKSEKTQTDKVKASPEDAKEQMDAWLKLAAPGEAHKRLEPMIGMFKSETTMWMDPSQPAQTSLGTMNNSWILGGRFVKSECKSEMAGMPFEGFGLMGYDNASKHYVGSWCDTFGTMLLTYDDGTVDASGKTISTSMTMDDPVAGHKVKMRGVTTIESKDRHTYEMFVPGPDGKEFKNLSIVYTRMSP